MRTGRARVADQHSPARNRAPLTTKSGGSTTLRELPWRGKINLRGAPQDAAFTRAAHNALGLELPRIANTTAAHEDGDLLAFWLGPDEWLLQCELARTEEIMRQLAAHLARAHHAATEVTDYYNVLEIAGDDAAAALARGCPLDLHLRAFKPGQCAQSRFGNASVLLHRIEDARFCVQVRWSFTEYVWDFLARAIDSCRRSL